MVKYSNNIYPGADYGLDSEYAIESQMNFGGGGYKTNVASIGITTDVRTADQLTEIFKKLGTGAKTIEVQGTSAEVLESIPKQHFREINRLKKLAGVDLTFHGPVIEASGWSGEAGWSEVEQKGAERQMSSAVERAHELEPDGNIVVTFHSSARLPELVTKTMGRKGEEVSEIIVFNERTGAARRLKPKENILLGEKPDPEREIKMMNKEEWGRDLTHLAFNVNQGQHNVERLIERFDKGESGMAKEEILELYKKSKTEEGQKFIQALSPSIQKVIKDVVNEVNFSEVYLRDSYTALQNHFNNAWVAVEKAGNKEELRKLDSYKRELQETIKKTDFEDPKNLVELGGVIQRGVNVLNSLKEVPQGLRPMGEFLVDKTSETFSEVALNSYKKFKGNSPIISIENPPAGGALSRAEDLKKLVEESRKKFVEKAREEFGMSEREAREQAEKLIGVTWDVGHINMLRKFGYGEKELVEEAKKIAPYVKHVHLSDNFGFEHTELPMGMGNVPTAEHLKAIEKYNKEVKKIVETGQWYQHFKVSPFQKTLSAFGSPIYSMRMAPYWNQAANVSGGYFAGYGQMLPEQHFSMYGAGFSMLPPELGGQFGGRSRAAGTPME